MYIYKLHVACADENDIIVILKCIFSLIKLKKNMVRLCKNNVIFSDFSTVDYKNSVDGGYTLNAC